MLWVAWTDLEFTIQPRPLACTSFPPPLMGLQREPLYVTLRVLAGLQKFGNVICRNLAPLRRTEKEGQVEADLEGSVLLRTCSGLL